MSGLVFTPRFLETAIFKALRPPLRTVVWGEQSHASMKISSLQHISLVSVKFHGDHKTVIKLS